MIDQHYSISIAGQVIKNAQGYENDRKEYEKYVFEISKCYDFITFKLDLKSKESENFSFERKAPSVSSCLLLKSISCSFSSITC